MNELVLIVVEFVLVLINCRMDFGAHKRNPISVEIVHDSDRFEFIKGIGSGNFGVTRLLKNKQSNELVALKYIARGSTVSSFLIAIDVC